MNQSTTLIAKSFFSLKIPGARGRPCMVSPGDRFAVVSPAHETKRTGLVRFDRERRAQIGVGYLLTVDQINTLFDVAEK